MTTSEQEDRLQWESEHDDRTDERCDRADPLDR